MTVDKINPQLPGNLGIQDKQKELRLDPKNRLRLNEQLQKLDQSDKADISEKAKKLQETEHILRFALEKLERFDQQRTDQFEDIHDRIDSDFYTSGQIDEELSERIFSNEQLQRVVQRNLDIRQHVASLKDIDANEPPIDEDKLASIRNRVQSGFYNDPDVLEQTADRILELLT